MIPTAFLVTSASISSLGQPAPAEPPPPPKPAAAFPASWQGHWRGTCRLLAPTAKSPREFTMELIIQPTPDPARWTWTMIYDEPAANIHQERRYELVIEDAAKGRYAIDEKSSIVLPATFLDGVLYSSFRVEGSQLTSTDRLLDAGTPRERIASEIITIRADRTSTTGGKDGVPEVTTFPVTSVQRAELTRVQAQEPKP